MVRRSESSLYGSSQYQESTVLPTILWLIRDFDESLQFKRSVACFKYSASCLK